MPQKNRLFTAARTLISETLFRKKPRKDDEIPGLVETSLLDPQRWRSLTREEVEFAAKYALWLTLNDWLVFFSSFRGKEKETLEVGSTGVKNVGGEPTLTPTQLHEFATHATSRISSVAKDEGLRSRLLALSETSELRAKVLLLGSQGLNLTRDCLDEFLKGYEVRFFFILLLKVPSTPSLPSP